MPWTWLAGRLYLLYQSVHQHNNPARPRNSLDARICQWHPIPFQYRSSSSWSPRHWCGQCHFRHQSYPDQRTPYTSCTSQVSSTLSCSFELRLWISWIARWICWTTTSRVYRCFEARLPRFCEPCMVTILASASIGIQSEASHQEIQSHTWSDYVLIGRHQL